MSDQNEVVAEQVKAGALEAPVPSPAVVFTAREVPIEEDIKRAWRRGVTLGGLRKRFNVSAKYLRGLLKYTKQKCDINKNDILIIKDNHKNKDKGAPRRPYVAKKA